jgi:hypothetical protein
MRQESIQNSVYKIVRRKFFDQRAGYEHDFLCLMFCDTMYYKDWVLYWVTNNTRNHTSLGAYYDRDNEDVYGHGWTRIEKLAFFRLLIIEDFINYLSQKR